MVIYLGADHRGFRFKEKIKESLKENGYEVMDCGNTVEDPHDDYVDYARAVAERVSRDSENSRGIVLCGSGAGVDITANKFPKVRSVLGILNDQVYAARHDDDVNVLSIAADFVQEDQAVKMAHLFLETKFGGEERHQRRIDKILQIEGV